MPIKPVKRYLIKKIKKYSPLVLHDSYSSISTVKSPGLKLSPTLTTTRLIFPQHGAATTVSIFIYFCERIFLKFNFNFKLRPPQHPVRIQACTFRGC